jgi:hypothetical protein
MTALHDGAGVMLVMMGIGTVVGAALGGAVSGVGTRFRFRDGSDPGPSFGQGTSAKDRDRNYWRDRGHPPFMKPSDALPDRHMFDPDRQD